jgi:hypothetical protein
MVQIRFPEDTDRCPQRLRRASNKQHLAAEVVVECEGGRLIGQDTLLTPGKAGCPIKYPSACIAAPSTTVAHLVLCNGNKQFSK